MRGRDEALARTAARQFGVFSGSQAIEAGYPRRTISDRAAREVWIRILRDCYRVAASVATWHQPIVAARLAVGDPAAISGRSALAMWELGSPPVSVPEVTVPWTRRPRLVGVACVRTRRWTRRDFVRLGSLQITSVERTLLDVAPLLPEADLEMAIDAAHRRKLLNPARFALYLGKAATNKVPGASKLRFLVELRNPGHALESEAETLLFGILRRARLPIPVPQYVVRTRSGRRRVDFAYPAERIAIEVDGYASHSGRAAFDDDRRRENELADAGWTLRHFTWTMLTDQPNDVVWTVATALGLEPNAWRHERRRARIEASAPAR